MPLKTIQIIQYKQRLDSLFKKGESLAYDSELLSNWARYLCVLISGFIEESVHVLILGYVKHKASPDVQHFIGCKIKHFQNAKMANILTLLEEFSVELKTKIEIATEGELKDAIDSIVQNRHQIAHGHTTGISFVTIKEYYGRVLKVVELLEAELAP